ncbi:protease [Arsenicitalea aurantiaca]|uniref:Protease n=1 Tax=Arsenicitalea aurantiaca TaxID=1783274 RepID=A0A433X453_9HYPH|nr:S8 family serine peptidase [Arsenicitalea aurantiaca]RUT28838.1 protease [Arsenicitalea aurantiaca]
MAQDGRDGMGDGPADPARRRLLGRLGLAAAIAYVAPVVLPLSGARASDGSFSAPSFSAPSFSAPSRPARREELVVALRNSADLDRLGAAGFEIVASQRLGLIEAHLARIRLAPGRSVDSARAEIASLLPDALVAPNGLYRPNELPCTDEGCAAFDMVGWRPSPDCTIRARIGMIDGPINPDHEALAGRALEIVALDQAGLDPAGRTHGTAIAALLVGDAASRTPGLLPEAELVAIEAFHTSAGEEMADAFSLLRALDRLAEAGVGVVNMSLAGPDNALLADAVRALAARGVSLVAAAGNAGPAAPPLYPAAYPEVLAVTAIDAAERVYRQASAGPHIAFAAPGVQLWTAASVSGGRFRSGTSYAAPFVTAAVAALIAAEPGLTPEARRERLVARVRDLGEPGRDPVFGFGLVGAEPFCALEQ